ncbi:MAG: rane alanine aminopeptidase [Caulobacter sp.]|nr:rane alanine aminopeptidase [Caulobacter sp.]
MLVLGLLAFAGAAHADPLSQTKAPFEDKFRQLEGEDWPTPTDYRNAAGAPGYRYWQQKVDYKIAATLDEPGRSIRGAGTVTYANNSPDEMRYLWLLLDQNRFKRDSLSELSTTVSGSGGISYTGVRRAKRMQVWEGGFSNLKVTGADGAPLKFTVVDSLMRIDLPTPLKSGQAISFSMEWTVPLIETRVIGGRGGYECFTKPDEDGNCLFLGSQWFPRLAVYSDYEGWHNKAFLGGGEFTLEFGDYDVSLTVPADHVVSATGALQNPGEVLSAVQQARLEKAKTAPEPIYIVTPAEAAAAEKGKATATKTWRFKADNVRDFAFASSRKFVWDAQGVKQDFADQPLVMAMSFYPKEARPLWDAFSTKAIVHTIKVYGEFAFPYPYPVAQSVNGPVGGMEYPMITFNGPRPLKDKKTGALTYTDRAKYGLIGVVIHEVGHSWFPMIVNSDERQWTWMDEGLNTFLQFEAQQRWDEKFPSRRGEPRSIVEYMVSKDQVPIMVQSDSLLQFGSNSYGKPAAALVILRETVLGRELFDYSFKEYARRWRFKRPTPYDFFRTMEEASGVDLDWFWRGWFYSTDHVDISLDKIVQARIDTLDPMREKGLREERSKQDPIGLTNLRNTDPTVVELDPNVRDLYDSTTEFTVTEADRKKARDAIAKLEPEEREALSVTDNFYHFTFGNLGGLVMPVILKMDFTDGTSETVRIPPEVWRKNSRQVTWQYVTPKTLKSALIDPNWETADADLANNAFPRAITPLTFKPASDDPENNRMKDMGLRVSPDGLATKPAPKKD